MNPTLLDRLNRMAPCDEQGRRVPKWVRCYDNGGETIDRYTVVFTRQNDGYSRGLAMSSKPFHPQGVCQHFEHCKTELFLGQWAIDRPKYGHLGKPIAFADLPSDCRKAVLQDYAEERNLPLEELLNSWQE